MKSQTLQFGQPVKYTVDRNYMESQKTFYCRVLGHGLFGDASSDDIAHNIVVLISPNGHISRKGISEIEPIDLIDYEQLKLQERKEQNPYNGILTKNSTQEEVLIKIKPLLRSINYKNINPRSLTNNFSRVGLENFANAVVSVANELAGKNLKLKLIRTDAINEFPIFNGSDEKVEIRRHMILLSNKKYPKNYRYLSHEKTFEPKYESQTSFREEKVELNENEILLYFSHPSEFYPFSQHVDYASPNTIHIAKLVNEKGVNKIVPNEIFTRNKHKEYISNNENFSFLPDFVKFVMKYKYHYNRPNLDKEDYDIIVNNYLKRYALVGNPSHQIPVQ